MVNECAWCGATSKGGYIGTSRTDNKTVICPECEQKEALDELTMGSLVRKTTKPTMTQSQAAQWSPEVTRALAKNSGKKSNDV